MFLLCTLPGGVLGGAAVKEDVQNRLEETFVTKRKNAVYGRLLCGLLAVLMALMLFPARETRAAEGDVAQIGDTTYATLDEAIVAAANGEETTVTIELLQSCTLGSRITNINNKSIVITASTASTYTITDSERK